MSGTYVPGYGYVDSSDPGTSGSVTKGSKRRDSGQTPRTPATTGGSAATGPYYEANRNAGGTSSTTTTTTASGSSYTYTPPEGVPYPMTGYGPLGLTGYGQRGGYEYGQRLGSNPDAREAFPYGVAYRDTTDAINAFYELDPGYQGFLKTLAQNPAIGTGASTGRALWERLVRMSEEQRELGLPNRSPQMLAAELAYNLGVSPEEGRDGSTRSSGGGSYGAGGGGYGGGGGGSTSQRIDLASPSQAQALLTQFMQASVGRNPKASEVKKFLELLQGYQTNNPTVVSASGNTVTQSGGIDPGMVAQEFVETLPDYTEAQADRYYRTFMSALLGGA